jgi:hypothetical protein
MGAHFPLLHVPPRQLWPHAPQFEPSLPLTLMQLPEQIVCPAPQTVQTPLTQVAPEMHWALLVQLVRQDEVPQANSLQLWVTARGQLPAPLHVAAKVSVPGEPEQLAVRQLTVETA